MEKNKIKHAIRVLPVVFLISIFVAGCMKNNTQRAQEQLKWGIDVMQTIDPGSPDKAKLKSAREHLNAALQSNPKLEKALCAIGTSYRYEKNYKEALAAYDKAIKLNPNYTVCIDNVGVTYSLLGVMDKAESAFFKAIAIDPTYADAHYNLGMLYSSQGKTGKAIQEYQTYISLAKDQENAAQAQAEILKLKEMK